MRYAIVDETRVEARPKLRGTCPNCRAEMVAKCGHVKVWHWAHKGRPPCDPWWESETDWHRAWKDAFPTEWQEVCHIDPVTGEKHIADIKSPFGLDLQLPVHRERPGAHC
jgi:competence protein CoiA